MSPTISTPAASIEPAPIAHASSAPSATTGSAAPIAAATPAPVTPIFAAGSAPVARPVTGPKPIIRLAASTIWVDGDELETATITLAFDYNGTRVAARSGRSAVARDRAAEAQARRVLESLGAIDLACLEDVACDPPVDYAVRLDRDVHALCGFSAHAVPQLRAMGWQVDVADDYPWRTVAPTTSIDVDITPEGEKADWFSLELGVEVDGKRVDLLPALLHILDGAGSLDQLARTPRRVLAVPVGDRTYLPIPPERLKLVLRVLRELYQDGDKPKLAAPVARAAALAELGAALHDPARPVRWRGATDLRDRGYDLALGPRTSTAPASLTTLRADLRSYQREGVEFLQHLRACGTGAVLADDMGLGKTLQTLALFLHVLDEQPDARFLVVAPTSVVANWHREADHFAPGVGACTITETAKRRGTELADAIGDARIVVTSYALFRIEFDDYRALDWDMLVLDEAQFVKNHRGKTYGCVRRLDATMKLAITGTPIENSLMDLWSLLSIVAPGLYPDPGRFSEVYRRPIESGRAPELLATLRRRVAPLMRRRTKDEVLTELPPKIEQTVDVELSPRHMRIYQTQLQQQRKKVLGLVGDVDKHRFEILRSLTILRQLSLDPALIDDGHDAVGSAKLDRLIEDLTQVVAEGHRALVFSTFTRYLARVKARLDTAGIGYSYLDGRTRKREQAISRFTDGDVPVFVISLKAGGFGLNLTQADYCFVLDPWWNPAAETQAVDRAHRIGQRNAVVVYRYVSTGTIEEKVMELKERKAALFSSVMDADDALSGALGADDIRALIGLPEAG